jgi:hypothetical protein
MEKQAQHILVRVESKPGVGQGGERSDQSGQELFQAGDRP